jgi:acyl-coenzyme A synthetase/AMP-(fatty) acid ligase
MIDVLDKIREIVKEIPTLERVIIIPYTLPQYQIDIRSIPKSIFWSDFVSIHNEMPQHIRFEQLPFDHPVYIMFSSGTTGNFPLLLLLVLLDEFFVHSANATIHVYTMVPICVG